MDEELVLLKRLDALRDKHRDIDEKIKALGASNSLDQLSVVRLKKEKLVLRDEIIRIEQQVYPDITA